MKNPIASGWWWPLAAVDAIEAGQHWLTAAADQAGWLPVAAAPAVAGQKGHAPVYAL